MVHEYTNQWLRHLAIAVEVGVQAFTAAGLRQNGHPEVINAMGG